MANGDAAWFFTDSYGRRWKLTVAHTRTSGVPRTSRVAGAIEDLLDMAFGPRSRSTRYVREDLIAICKVLTGRSDDRMEAVREILVEGLERGWLRCEAVAQVVVADLDMAPDTVPTPPSMAPEPLTWFELRVVDEVGEAIPEVDVAFGVGTERRVIPTDARGVARLEDASASFVSVALANPSQLREKLGPRWSKPRRSRLPSASEAHIKSIDTASESLSLESEKTSTVAITPLFRCEELAGSHFAFGRSFVFQSALASLSLIAAAVLEDDARRAMIFGHTDIAGPDALNKELSERRAKALFAILTHDPLSWEELWTGSGDGKEFREKWGIIEAQHLLNALGVPDDDGEALVEDGIDGARTRQAMKRFQRGDYDGARTGRHALPETGRADEGTRKELLFSYASLVTHDPIPRERFATIGDAPFMGCGEFNPLSTHGRDVESRRAVVFVFDAAAQPQDLPCRLRTLGPCKSAGHVDDLVTPRPDDKPYRCSIYREVASSCPCASGEELMPIAVQLHDRDYNPVPNTQYVLVVANERHVGTTDSDGVLHAAVRRAQIAFAVTYHPPEERVPITLKGQVFPPELEETDQALLQKIRNLGLFGEGDSEAFAIRKFQDAHKKLARTGNLDDATKQALRQLDDDSLRDVLEDEDAPAGERAALRDSPPVGDTKPVGDAKKKTTPNVVLAKLAPEQRLVLVLTLRDRWGSPLPNMKMTVRQAGAELKAPGGAALVTDASGRTIIDNVVPSVTLDIKLDDQHLPADDEDRRKTRYVYTIEDKPEAAVELQVDDDPNGSLAMVDTKRAYATYTVGVDLFRPVFRFPWQNPIHREDAPERMYRTRVPNLQHALTTLFGVPAATANALDHAGAVNKLVELFEQSKATIVAEAAKPPAPEATDMGTAPEPPAPPSPTPPSPPSTPEVAPPVQAASRSLPARDVTPTVEPPKPPAPRPPPQTPDAAQDSAAFPRWVYYLLFHNTGLRYSPPFPSAETRQNAGAHGHFIKPSLFLDRIRQREIEASFGDAAGPPDATAVTEALVLIERKKASANHKAALLSNDPAKTKKALTAVFTQIKNGELTRLDNFRTPDKFYDGDYVALGLLKAKRLASRAVLTDDIWKQIGSRTQLRNDVQADGWEDIRPPPAELQAFFGKQTIDTTQWRPRRQQTLDTLISYAVCDQASETGEVVRSGNVGKAIPGNATTPAKLFFMTSANAKLIRRGMHLFFNGFGTVKATDQLYVDGKTAFEPDAIFEANPDPADPKETLLQLTPMSKIARIANLEDLLDPDDPSNKAPLAENKRREEQWKKEATEAEAANKPIPPKPALLPRTVVAPGKEFSGVRFLEGRLLNNAVNEAIVRCVTGDDKKIRLAPLKWTHQEIVVDVKVAGSSVRVFTFSTGGGPLKKTSGIRERPLDALNTLFAFMHTAVKENTAILDAALLNPGALKLP